MSGVRMNSFSESDPATLIHIHLIKSFAARWHVFCSKRLGCNPSSGVTRLHGINKESETVPGFKFPPNQSLLGLDLDLVVKTGARRLLTRRMDSDTGGRPTWEAVELPGWLTSSLERLLSVCLVSPLFMYQQNVACQNSGACLITRRRAACFTTPLFSFDRAQNSLGSVTRCSR